MLKVVSWNIDRLHQPWRELAEMAQRGEATLRCCRKQEPHPATSRVRSNLRE